MAKLLGKFGYRSLYTGTVWTILIEFLKRFLANHDDFSGVLVLLQMRFQVADQFERRLSHTRNVSRRRPLPSVRVADRLQGVPCLRSIQLVSIPVTAATARLLTKQREKHEGVSCP